MLEVSLARARRCRSKIAVAAQVENLENRLLTAAVTQTITITDQKTGRALAGAKVVVTDGAACYTAVTTNASGQVKVTTNGGVRTITAYRDGYAPVTKTINKSSLNYSSSLKPLATAWSKESTSVIVSDAWALAKLIGTPKYLGQATVSQVLSTAIIGSAGAAGSCLIASAPVITTAVSAPCFTASAAAFGATSAAQTIYSAAVDLGLVQNRLLNFYYIPILNQIFVTPAK
jgi:hypothetical protein